MKTKKKTKGKKSWWSWWKILLAILVVLWLLDNWSDKNCDLEFETYTYSAGCYGACESKCYDEGFDGAEDGYTLNYITYEGERRHCECHCRGCR